MTPYINDVLQWAKLYRRARPSLRASFDYNPNAPKYSFDLETRLRNTCRRPGVVRSGTKGFKFTLLYNSGNVARKTACEMLAKELASIQPQVRDRHTAVVLADLSG